MSHHLSTPSWWCGTWWNDCRRNLRNSCTSGNKTKNSNAHKTATQNNEKSCEVLQSKAKLEDSLSRLQTSAKAKCKQHTTDFEGKTNKIHSKWSGSAQVWCKSVWSILRSPADNHQQKDMVRSIVHSQTFQVKLKLSPASTELGTAQLQLVFPFNDPVS